MKKKKIGTKGMVYKMVGSYDPDTGKNSPNYLNSFTYIASYDMIDNKGNIEKAYYTVPSYKELSAAKVIEMVKKDLSEIVKNPVASGYKKDFTRYKNIKIEEAYFNPGS